MDNMIINPYIDFSIRMAFTVALLYALYALLDYLYRGNNRFPVIFGAIDRGVSFLLSAPFGGDKGLSIMAKKREPHPLLSKRED